MSTASVVNAPAPATHNTAITMLDHLGAVIKNIFTKGLPVATAVATDIEPIVAAEFPAISSLFDTTVQLVANAQATGLAAASTQSTGAAKLAVTAPIVESVAEGLLKEFGVSLSSTQAEAWTTGVVNLVKLLPAPANSPAAAPAA